MERRTLPAPLARVVESITPHPHRGDQVAAGAVVLAVAVAMVNVRMGGSWEAGALFVLDALAAALLLGMGVLAPLEDGAPRAYKSALLVAGLLVLALALGRLAVTLGASSATAAGALTWTMIALAAKATYCARACRSAACTLIAALAAAIALLAFVEWVFDPQGPETLRWMLLVVVVTAVLAALQLRERARRHAVMLVDTAGLALIVLALTWLLPQVLGLELNPVFGAAPGGVLDGVSDISPGLGWELVLLAGAFALVAYAAVDREPGPGYLGVLGLVLTALVIGAPSIDGASLVGWPLLLLVLGIAGVVLGLRPRQPLPPPPTSPASDEPTATQPIPMPPAGGMRSSLFADEGSGSGSADPESPSGDRS